MLIYFKLYVILNLFLINLRLYSTQWNNNYRFLKNCNDDEIPPFLISNKLDTCLGSIEYSCSDDTTIETFYKKSDCLTKTIQKSYNNNICKNNQLKNCTLSSIPSLPPKSFIMAVYPNDDVNCHDDSRITQFSTIPLDICSYGLIYKCDSNSSLIVEKYSDENCTILSNKSKESLGCVHNNPIYRVMRYFCTF